MHGRAHPGALAHVVLVDGVARVGGAVGVARRHAHALAARVGQRATVQAQRLGALRGRRVGRGSPRSAGPVEQGGQQGAAPGCRRARAALGWERWPPLRCLVYQYRPPIPPPPLFTPPLSTPAHPAADLPRQVLVAQAQLAGGVKAVALEAVGGGLARRVVARRGGEPGGRGLDARRAGARTRLHRNHLLDGVQLRRGAGVREGGSRQRRMPPTRVAALPPGTGLLPAPAPAPPSPPASRAARSRSQFSGRPSLSPQRRLQGREGAAYRRARGVWGRGDALCQRPRVQAP